MKYMIIMWWLGILFGMLIGFFIRGWIDYEEECDITDNDKDDAGC